MNEVFVKLLGCADLHVFSGCGSKRKYFASLGTDRRGKIHENISVVHASVGENFCPFIIIGIHLYVLLEF